MLHTRCSVLEKPYNYLNSVLEVVCTIWFTGRQLIVFDTVVNLVTCSVLEDAPCGSLACQVLGRQLVVFDTVVNLTTCSVLEDASSGSLDCLVQGRRKLSSLILIC